MVILDFDCTGSCIYKGVRAATGCRTSIGVTAWIQDGNQEIGQRVHIETEGLVRSSPSANVHFPPNMGMCLFLVSLRLSLSLCVPNLAPFPQENHHHHQK